MTLLEHRFSALLVSAGLLATAGVMGPPAALGQPASDADRAPTPLAQASRGVAAIGRRWDADVFSETVRLYTAVHRGIEWPGVRAAEAIRYGDDPRQTLRLYRPEQGFSEPGPVFLFLHGNGLGDSDQVAPESEDLIYGHIGKLGAAFGGIGITANYRNGGSASELAGARDIGRIIAWITANIATYGGDPGTIVLLANSDGAAHAAAYLFDAESQPEAGPRVAAAMLISGRFTDTVPSLANLIDTYSGPRVPLALWVAEYDTSHVEIGIVDLFSQLCRKYQDCPSFAELPGHNHVSHVMSLGTEDTSVQNALIRFYHTVR